MELSEQDLEWAKKTIEKTELFTSCSETELAELLSGLDKRHYDALATIIFQGEISNRLCLIENGQVSVWIKKSGQKVKMADLGPGSYFGEISLLTPRAATATVKAETTSDIILLPGEVVQGIVKKNPVLAEILNKKIEERLQSQKKIIEEE